MKKFKLLSIFMFVVSLFVLCSGVKAETKQLRIIKDTEYPEIQIYNDENYTQLVRQVNILKETNGHRLYCMEMGKKTPDNGVEMTSDGVASTKSHVYGYIKSNVSRIGQANSVKYLAGTEQTGFSPDNLEDVSRNYLKVQFAIWLYDNGNITRDETDITSIVLSMYPGMKTVVNEAKDSQKNTLDKELTVTISGNTAMKLSDDNKTYESEKLTVTSSRGGDITLSTIANGIEDIEIYNESGKKVTKVSSGSKVVIKVPAASLKLGKSAFKLKANVEGQDYAMYIYNPKDTIVQSVGKLESKGVKAEASKEFNIEKKSTTKFSKISVVNQEELPGATLKILDENKEPLMDPNGKPYEWVSTDEPHYIEGLPAGNYYLQEIIAPEGYVMSDELVAFTVKEDGSITEVIMENDLEVEVPDTLSSRSILLLVIGMFDIALGIGILLYVKKNKATE